MQSNRSSSPKLTRDEVREKVRENRLRRVLDRRELALMKQRRRDPNAVDCGLYAIRDLGRNLIIAGADRWGRNSFTLDDVEDWLNDEDEKEEKTV